MSHTLEPEQAARPIVATVAITGMNATDNPAPGVAVARSLRHAPAFAGRIVGLGYDALDPGFYVPELVDAAAILPYPSSGREALKDRLLEIQSELGLDVLVPTLDSELRAVAAIAPELEASGIATFVPTIASIDRVSKAALPELGAAAGVGVPESEPVTTPEAIGKLVDRFELPLVVKGVYYGARIVHTEAQAVAAFHHFVASWGLPVIVQRFVGGEEYNVVALGDGTGQMVGAVPMRKMALTDKGKGWSGVTIADAELLRATERLVGALGWRGGIEIECIRDAESGELYVAEVNPRFPAWTFLATGAGQNLPVDLIRLALGESVAPQRDYRVGTQFVRIFLDQISDLGTFGALSAGKRWHVPGAKSR